MTTASGESRGFAFIRFVNYEDHKRVLRESQFVIGGRKVMVKKPNSQVMLPRWVSYRFAVKFAPEKLNGFYFYHNFFEFYNVRNLRDIAKWATDARRIICLLANRPSFNTVQPGTRVCLCDILRRIVLDSNKTSSLNTNVSLNVLVQMGSVYFSTYLITTLRERTREVFFSFPALFEYQKSYLVKKLINFVRYFTALKLNLTWSIWCV